MNEEQVKAAVRWIVSTFGAAIAGFFAGKGWFTVDQVMGFLNSGTFIGAVVSLAGLVWGMFVHTKANAVATVDAMPEVAGVLTKPTVEGVELAKSVPSPTVAPAGTVAATTIAAN